MHGTDINILEGSSREAGIKALREGVTVSEAWSDLLARWVVGETELGDRQGAGEEFSALALQVRGAWAARGPDARVPASRAGPKNHD